VKREGQEYLTEWGAQNPKEVGASGYSAIYECLTDALTNCEEEVDDEPLDFAIAILDEFIGHAEALKKQIGAARKATTTNEYHPDGRRKTDAEYFRDRFAPGEDAYGKRL